MIYEERIVLLRAASFEEAIHRAETEAEKYARDIDAEFLGYVDIYHLFDRKVHDWSEIFSLLRENELPPQMYIDRFFATGKEYRGEQDNNEPAEEL